MDALEKLVTTQTLCMPNWTHNLSRSLPKVPRVEFIDLLIDDTTKVDPPYLKVVYFFRELKTNLRSHDKPWFEFVSGIHIFLRVLYFFTFS